MTWIPLVLVFVVSQYLYDLQKCQFNVPHNLEWKNGYPVVKKPSIGIGGEPLVTQSVLYNKTIDPIRYCIVYAQSTLKMPIKDSQLHYCRYMWELTPLDDLVPFFHQLASISPRNQLDQISYTIIPPFLLLLDNHTIIEGK